MAWVLGERIGLVATVVQAAESHPHEAIRLSADLGPILLRARALADWETAATAAVQATHRAATRTVVSMARSDACSHGFVRFLEQRDRFR